MIEENTSVSTDRIRHRRGGVAQRGSVVRFPGVGRDHLTGECIDPTPAACRALCARLQDAESVCIVPMTAEVLATQCFGAVDAAQRAAEHTGNMRRFAHPPSVSGCVAQITALRAAASCDEYGVTELVATIAARFQLAVRASQRRRVCERVE